MLQQLQTSQALLRATSKKDLLQQKKYHCNILKSSVATLKRTIPMNTKARILDTTTFLRSKWERRKEEQQEDDEEGGGGRTQIQI